MYFIIAVPEARKISIRSASYSTWLFPFFKWPNFSPLNFMKPTTQCYIGSLSLGVFEQRSSTGSGLFGFLSCGFAQIQRQIVSGRKDTTQYKLDRQSRLEIAFDQISPSASSTRDLGSRLLNLPNENAKARRND